MTVAKGLFQYPQSDRALCNAGREGVFLAVFSLSVSPIGSSPLQPTYRRHQRRRRKRFQYPQSDRALCNRAHRESRRRRPTRLSVSPIGSSPLQLVHIQVYPPDLGTFSIPNRIEPSATRPPHLSAGGERDFQYPQSDRALCNAQPGLIFVQPVTLSVSPIGSSPLQLLPKGAGVFQYIVFQYPQSDRALCNTG